MDFRCIYTQNFGDASIWFKPFLIYSYLFPTTELAVLSILQASIVYAGTHEESPSFIKLMCQIIISVSISAFLVICGPPHCRMQLYPFEIIRHGICISEFLWLVHTDLSKYIVLKNGLLK